MAPSPSSTRDFAVVGGGIVGACLADELAATGASVVVLDAGPEPGHATNQAAGVAVPSLRYLKDPEFYAWLLSAKSCLDNDVHRLEPEYGAFSVPKPILRALRQADIDQFGAEMAGLDLGRWVEADELATVAVDMKLPAGRRYLLDGNGLMVDGRRYLRAVREGCLAGGVEWMQDTVVRYVEEEGSSVAVVTQTGVVQADRVVVAAGAWSSTRGLAEGTGVGPQRGQLVILEATVDISCILSSKFYLAQGVDGRVVVGATEEDAGFDERVTTEGISRLLMFASAAMPSIGQSVPVELRAGLRPVSATGVPVVGRVPGRERVYVCAGHAGHGLLSARATAQGLAAGLARDDWDRLPYLMCPSEVVRG
jgi:glycine oxidase